MKRVVINGCLLLIIVLCLMISVNLEHGKSIYIDNSNYLAPIIEGDNYLNIDDFNFDNVKNIIYDVPVGTTSLELLNVVDTNGEKAIYNSVGVLVEDNANLRSTDILKIQFDEENIYEYEISVLGDILGDGNITPEGLRAIVRYIINGEGLNDIALLAADYNHDGEIEMNDVTQILFDITLPDENNDDEDSEVIKYTANFVVTNGYISNVTYSEINCEVADGSNSCDIIAPVLNVNEGYEAVGFTDDPMSTNPDFVGGEIVSITSDVTYYAIVKKVIVAELENLNSNAVYGNVPRNISCAAYNGEESCEITFPTPMLISGYELVGYSEDRSATEANLIGGSKLTISEGTKFYLITKRTVTITFDKNTTYDNNSVLPGESGYNYAKTNIEADSLSFYQTTCDSYNDNGCYIDEVPIIYSAGNEPRGFSTMPNSNSTIAVFENKYYSNKTLYARVYNDMSESDYVLGYSEQVGNVMVEFEEGMDANMVAGYVEYIRQLYRDIPELFLMKGKMRMFKKATYETVYGRIGSEYINTAGCTSSIYTGSLVDIKLRSETSVEEYRKGTIVHELSHAFDNYYGTKMRNYFSGKVRDRTDVINLYNSYLNQSPRPLRDYSYTSIAEFWADSVRWYYSEDLNGFDNAAALAGTSFQPATEEIKNNVRNYMCIARNNYSEGAICP